MDRATPVPVSGSKLDNRRVLAALIDLVIVGAGYAVILAAAGKLGDAGAGGALTAVGVGWALYYYFACESGAGQTVGKRVMNIRVVSTDGAPAGMREIGLRTVLRLIDGLFIYLVGLIVMLATRERRGRLGDLVGGTMIESAERPSAVEPIAAAPETPAAARVPIAESGPAFAKAEVEAEPEPAEAEVAEVAPAEAAELEVVPAESAEAEVAAAEPDVASPSLKELASDVTAVTEDPDREVEDEPEAEEAPTVEVAPVEELEVEAAEEPEAEEEAEVQEPVVEDEPAAEAEEEPEADEEVTVKSVETVSAIDLVMEDGDEEAVAGSQAEARQG